MKRAEDHHPMAHRQRMRQRIIGALMILFGASLFAQENMFPHRVTAGLADLRPQGWDAEDAAARARGQALLRAAVKAQGGDAWAGHTTLSVTGLDAFREPGPWWPQQNQRIRLLQRLGTFTSRVTLLDGPQTGAVWGIQSWRPYKAEDARSAPTFLDHDLPIEFYLPTLHYFNELPFRLLNAPIAIDLGGTTLHGADYDRVFVTWRTPEPTDEVDQYVVWIDRGSGLITKAHYTVRDVATMPGLPEEERATMRAGAAGTIHFSDFREIDGAFFPFRQVVTLFGPTEAGPDPGEGSSWVHIFSAEHAAFDAAPPALLLPDPALPEPADSKP